MHFALCLDGIASGEVLNMHVSKRPAPDSNVDRFHRKLADTTRKVLLSSRFLKQLIPLCSCFRRV